MTEYYFELGLFTWFSQQKPGLPFSGTGHPLPYSVFLSRATPLQQCFLITEMRTRNSPRAPRVKESKGPACKVAVPGQEWEEGDLNHLWFLHPPSPGPVQISWHSWWGPCCGSSRDLFSWTSGVLGELPLGAGPITGFLLPWRPYTYIHSPSHRRADV